MGTLIGKTATFVYIYKSKSKRVNFITESIKFETLFFQMYSEG